MPNYRRSKRKGGTFFFTVNLQNRHSNLLIEHIDLLRGSVRYVIKRRPFIINAWVVLPDHIHAVWTLPEGDCDYSRRWQQIKMLFTKRVHNRLKTKSKIWQNRFWEHEIRTDEDFHNHVCYAYLNPVKHGYVESTRDWPYSSFHRDARLGIFDIHWNGLIDS